MLAAAAALALSPLLGACGNADAPDASTKPAATTASSSPTESASVTPKATAATSRPARPLPKCADVWVAGQRLPGRYRGCAPQGPLRDADRTYCESGQLLVTFHNRMFAITSGKIFSSDDARHDHDYRFMQRYCTG